jgi:ParB family chromosome partitioning protein
LPEDSAELFAALLAMEQDELVRLLAVCVASTVDVVTPRHAAPARRGTGAGRGPRHGRMVEADRGRLLQARSKAVILEAVGEFAPDPSPGWRSSRRPTLPAKPSGWPMARAGCPPSSRPKARRPQEEGPEQDAPEDAEAMADEPAEALAA